MALSNEQMLNNFIDLMDKAGLPHNCNGDNLIEINKVYTIELDKSTIPWQCKLLKNGEKIYTSNPTGIIIVTKAVIAYDKRYKKD